MLDSIGFSQKFIYSFIYSFFFVFSKREFQFFNLFIYLKKKLSFILKFPVFLVIFIFITVRVFGPISLRPSIFVFEKLIKSSQWLVFVHPSHPFFLSCTRLTTLVSGASLSRITGIKEWCIGGRSGWCVLCSSSFNWDFSPFFHFLSIIFIMKNRVQGGAKEKKGRSHLEILLLAKLIKFITTLVLSIRVCFKYMHAWQFPARVSVLSSKT